MREEARSSLARLISACLATGCESHYVGFEGVVYAGKTTRARSAAQSSPRGVYIPETFSFIQSRFDETLNSVDSFLAFQIRLFDFEAEKSRFASNLSLAGHTVFCDRTIYSPLLFSVGKLFLDKRSVEQKEYVLERLDSHIRQTTGLMLPSSLKVLEVSAEDQSSRARLDPERNTDAHLFHEIFHELYRYMQETVADDD